MRADRILLGVTLLAVSTGAVFADASTGGYLAMYNVRYSNDALAGDLQGITISFGFDQWIWDYDPETQTDNPHVFEDLKVNVTFPEPRNDGSTIFLVGTQQPSLILIDHDILLGDVAVGVYHYELHADLPAAPFYCIELDLPPDYRQFLSTETAFCPMAV